MSFRLNIDTEFQGWILLFATLTAVWVYCLPCFCAGQSLAVFRRFASWLSMRLPYFLVFATIFNAGMLFLVITWLPDWGYGEYVGAMMLLALWMATHLAKFMTSIVMIVGFCFVVIFKDRILKVIGLDHRTFFRCKLRDILSCGYTSVRPIEVLVLKAEDLPSAQLLAPNNVFVEIYFGYNEPMKTRVHNNAGSSCILKEQLQLNWDETEDEDVLFIFVKNQKVFAFGNSELGRLELNVSDLKKLEQACKELPDPNGWPDQAFIKKELIPSGAVWLHVRGVHEEGHGGIMC